MKKIYKHRFQHNDKNRYFGKLDINFHQKENFYDNLSPRMLQKFLTFDVYQKIKEIMAKISVEKI